MPSLFAILFYFHLSHIIVTPTWRDLYCEYVGIDRAVMEHIMLTAVGDLHFILHDIEKPTPEELQEIIAWVESRVNNSEELET